MGCGSSKSSTIVSHHPTSQKVSHAHLALNTSNTSGSNLPTSLDLHSRRRTSSVSAVKNHDLPVVDGRNYDGASISIPTPSPSNVKSSTEWVRNEGSSVVIDALASMKGSHSMRLIQPSANDLGKRDSAVIPNIEEITSRNSEIHGSVNEGVPTPSLPVPDTMDKHIVAIDKFNRLLKQSCKLNCNEKLVETAPSVNTLDLDRSFYSFTKTNLLCKVVSVMKHLHTLKLSGGQMGPIAFRFIVATLSDNESIKHLDLSDNMANPECSTAIGSMLAINSTLQVLNVSGNRLGKDALSRHVGSALLENPSLKSLDISNCGATDLHCLCESIAKSTCSCLTALNAADNAITNDQQFAIDISQNLESANCKLKEIDVSNTSIGSGAMDTIIKAISQNISICSLRLGKNSVANLKRLCAMLLTVCTHPKMTLFSIAKTNVVDTDSCDFVEWANDVERDLKETCQLRHLDVSDCALNDDMLQYLASQLTGKLSNLEFLDVSKNDIGPEGLGILKQLCSGELQELKVLQISNPNGMIEAITSRFPVLSLLDVSKSKLPKDDMKTILSHGLQNASSLFLNGMRMGGFGVFSESCDIKTFSVTDLHLSVCQLNDDDLKPLCDVLGQNLLISLQKLDVSVNRLTSIFVKNLFESLLKHTQHGLRSLNSSNNLIDGRGLESLMTLHMTESHSSCLKSVNFAHNNITATYVTDFMSRFSKRRFPLQSLDLSFQNETFVESDMEDLARVIEEAMVLEANMWNECEFVIDLRGNGGSEILNFSLVDSLAVRTDFVTKRKPSLTLRDLIEIRRGLYFQKSGNTLSETCAVSANLWKDIVLKDAPAWVFVNSELSKAAYITHMPIAATSQHVQGMLEMDADCDVKDFFLVKDPMTQQSTGTAWVLFQDLQSLDRAVEWFYTGNACVFGSQFCISEVPVTITEGNDGAVDAADKDLEIRNVEARQQFARDQKVLEDSLQLAAERAEYRELHPAYQGGRIS